MSRYFVQFLNRFRRRQSLARDERGTTIIEFALLATPFFLIIGGILQTSVVFLATQVMESAVHDATRAIRTGQIQQARGTITTFRDAVCERLFGLFPDCSGLHIRVNEITNFETATVVPPLDMSCAGTCDWTMPQSWVPGGGKSVVLVQVFYRYPIPLSFGPFGMANLSNGQRLLGTATVFQNEPFTWSG